MALLSEYSFNLGHKLSERLSHSYRFSDHFPALLTLVDAQRVLGYQADCSETPSLIERTN